MAIKQKKSLSELESINDIIKKEINAKVKSQIPNVKNHMDSIRKLALTKLKEVIKLVNNEFDQDSECWDVTTKTLMSSYQTIPINNKTSKQSDNYKKREERIKTVLGDINITRHDTSRSSSSLSSKSSGDKQKDSENTTSVTSARIKIVYEDKYVDILNNTYHVPDKFSFNIKYTVAQNKVDIKGNIVNSALKSTNSIDIPVFENDVLIDSETIATNINNALLEKFYIPYYSEREFSGIVEKQLKTKEKKKKESNSIITSEENSAGLDAYIQDFED